MSADVLLVDDDQPLCETLEIGLRKRGHRVAWRTHAAEALKLLDEQTFDVVVSDLNMREMGGLELCERVALNRPDIPVILLTGFGSLDSAVAA
ncbi:MAG: response regulator, partial [Polyangiaceae bacterium]